MSRLRDRRLRLGLAQGSVAAAAGLSRQALSALEAGRSLPALATALRVAAILDTTVEALFGEAPGDGQPVWQGSAAADGRARWARIGGRLVLRPALAGEEADAVIDTATGDRPALRALPGAADPDRVVWLAGCDPALPLLARAIERAAPGLEATALPMTTAGAQQALAAGMVHLASLHGPADASDVDAAPERRGRPYIAWREGFVLGPGVDADALASPELRWALRPVGATARELFERARPTPDPRVAVVASGHWGVAEAIRAGEAEAGVGVEAAAAAFGLGFVPLAEERVSLYVHPEAAIVDEALDRALDEGRLWSRLDALTGYRRLAT